MKAITSIYLLGTLALLSSCASNPRAEQSTVPVVVKDGAGTTIATYEGAQLNGERVPLEVRAIGSEATIAEVPAEETVTSTETRSLAAQELETVYFDTDVSDLDAEAKAELDKVVELLKTNTASIRIEGFADHPGSTDYNLALSQRRARSVKNYLDAQGADAKRVSLQGYGENPGTERKVIIRTLAE